MDKHILEQYIDACELIRETEEDIRRLQQKKNRTLQDKVYGSNPEFPYEARSFQIEGVDYSLSDLLSLERLEQALTRRKESARKYKIKVDEWLPSIPPRMQKIIKWRFFEGLSWMEVARKCGMGATPDSIRMEVTRFLNQQ